MKKPNATPEGIGVRVVTPLVIPLLGMPKAPEGGQIYGGNGADWVEIYSIETIDSLLSLKANITSVYSKADADSIFATKTELSDLDNKVDGINETLTSRINAVEGLGGYIPAHDFGKANPTQQELTDYAVSVIPNITDPTQIFNGTRVTNLYNNHLWILTNTPSTTPPVFEWADNGLGSVSTADNNGTLGVVTGSLDALKVKINTDGTMSVNGLSAALALKVDVGTVYTKAEADTLLAEKANINLNNTGLISDCIIDAPNGIFAYSSGMRVSIKSLLKVLFPNGRDSSRKLASIPVTLSDDVGVVITGSAGDKITVFLDHDGNAFQVLSSQVKKGASAPSTSENYAYFKNINTNFWQKKATPAIDWTAGFAFTFGSPYQWVCSRKVSFNGQLIMQISGRYQSSYPTRMVATTNGITYATLDTASWGNLASANRLLYASEKGITTDLNNWSAVTFPNGFSLSQIYGIGNWFYLFDTQNKLAYKTQDFQKYIAFTYPPFSDTSYFTTAFDVDDSGNMLCGSAYPAAGTGAAVYAQTYISKDNGQTWTSTGHIGVSVKIANGIMAIGTTSGILQVSTDSGASWQAKTLGGASDYVWSIEFGGGTWNVALTTATLFQSTDNFSTITQKNTGFSTGGSPSILFVNGVFFMTDFTSSSYGWTSTSTIYYAQPATQDETVIVTDILTCEINSAGSGLINIQPKYPDLFQMLGLVQMAQDISAIKAELGL